MKSASALNRLLAPAIIASALLLSLGYWWLDNLPHEIFGSLAILALGWHLYTHRRWFATVFKGSYGAKRRVSVALHALLAANMLVLIGTSVAISQSVFAFLPFPDLFLLRDVHWFSAYWVILFAGIHLGLHWGRVMAMIRRWLQLPAGGRAATLLLRVTALLLFLYGAWSFVALGVFEKLTFTYRMAFWDFTSSVAPFFAHWAGVMAAAACVSHYGMRLWARR